MILRLKETDLHKYRCVPAHTHMGRRTHALTNELGLDHTERE